MEKEINEDSKSKLKIFVIAKLKPSQVEYKLHPLVNSQFVEQVYLLRRMIGPSLPKLKYLVLPSLFNIKLLYVLLTPIWAIYHVRKVRPDLILSYHFIPHGFNAALVSAITRVPFIYSQIDRDIEYLTNHRIFGTIILFLLKKARYIFTPGTRSYNFWIAKGIPEEKLRILHSSIDTQSKFNNLNEHKMYDIIYIGTFDNNKRISFLLSVFQEVIKVKSDARIAIAGFGSLEGEIIEFIKVNDLERNLSFLGRINDPEKLIPKAKMFIMASIDEGLPCALMEAMASELLVFATPAGDIPDIVVDGQTGILIKDLDALVVSKKIINALSSFHEYKNMTKAARSKIVAERSYTYTTELWDNILQGKIN